MRVQRNKYSPNNSIQPNIPGYDSTKLYPTFLTRKHATIYCRCLLRFQPCVSKGFNVARRYVKLRR